MSLKEARKHLDLARKQFDGACIDSWEPVDAGQCVSKVFYAYENLVVAAAECHSIRWTKNHVQKAAMARELHAKKILSTDLSDELTRLNNLRKDVSYGEPGFELADIDLESLVNDLESVVDEVASIVRELETEATNE